MLACKTLANIQFWFCFNLTLKTQNPGVTSMLVCKISLKRGLKPLELAEVSLLKAKGEASPGHISGCVKSFLSDY